MWYPFWDAGLKLSPAAHSPKSLLQLARGDLVTATSILGVRPLAGDRAVVQAVGVDARRAVAQAPAALAAAAARRVRGALGASRRGQLAARTEPQGRTRRAARSRRAALGGRHRPRRRDRARSKRRSTSSRARPACCTRCGASCTVSPAARATCSCSRNRTRSPGRCASPTREATPTSSMRRVSAAARAIDWAGGRFWRRVDRVQSGRSVTRRQHALPEPIPGAALVDDELDIVDEAAAGSPRDESFPLRIAGAASRLGVPLSRRALAVLADQVHADRRGPTTPWPERTRRAFVGLLGSGPAMVTTVESLEHYGVFSHYLPEWQHVRSLPQRNAFHLYNVDRHLLRAVANANELVRTVGRPDLLLVGALMHDIGKGYPQRPHRRRHGDRRHGAAAHGVRPPGHGGRAGDGRAPSAAGRDGDASRPVGPAHRGQRGGGRRRPRAAAPAARPHRGRQPRHRPVGVVTVEAAPRRPARRRRGPRPARAVPCPPATSTGSSASPGCWPTSAAPVPWRWSTSAPASSRC